MACKQRVDNQVIVINDEAFGEKKDLIGNVLDLDSLWKPSRIIYADSCLVLIDRTCKNFVQIYDVNTLHKQVENIPMGDAPGELLDLGRLQVLKDYIYAIDPELSICYKYNRSMFLKNSNTNPVETILLPYGSMTSVVMPDSVIWTSCFMDKKTLVSKYDYNRNRMPFILSFPTETTDTDSISMKLSFMNNMFYNEQAGKIVMTYTSSDIVDIYNSNMLLLARIQGPDCFFPEMVGNVNGAMTNASKRIAYTTCYLTKDNIWLLSYNDDYNVIYKIGYNGELNGRYRVSYSVISFCVDDNESTIYAISDTPERSVVKYNL